jgi:hypothetical protein
LRKATPQSASLPILQQLRQLGEVDRSSVAPRRRPGAWPLARLWLMRHALQQSQLVRRKTVCGQANALHISGSRGAPVLGKTMFRSTQLRFRDDWLVCSGRSLADRGLRTGIQSRKWWSWRGSNSTFADPDEQVNIFGFGQGAQPSGLNGPVQFGARQGQLTPFRHFQSNGLSSPPDPLSRPSN